MQTRMEALAEEMRGAVLRCEPLALLGFLWTRAAEDEHRGQHALKGHLPISAAYTGYALEYVHAVLSSHLPSAAADYSGSGEQVLALAAELWGMSTAYCGVAEKVPREDPFGNRPLSMYYHAMHSWIAGRGYRYQPLEAEFFTFVLAPHDDVLIQLYGMPAAEIAHHLQAALNTPISFSEDGSEDALARQRNAEARDLARTSALPMSLLADLAYVRGEEQEFFAPGALRGTPLRTMPARVKPLVVIGDGYYACDPYFIRDSTYRAIQRAVIRRLPDYLNTWRERQTELTEHAFQHLLQRQLRGAEVLHSVRYGDLPEKPDTDMLILLGDVLLVIEVKAGVMAMHSPALHFDQYIGKVTDLVLKAYRQAARFLRYAASREVVPLYQKEDGKYREVRRLRLADYRKVIPIGLTLEAFTPISSNCKNLEEIQPILGQHPFISMSIDDLMVLSHFLPGSGELFHYLEVRQHLAGIKQAFLYDEVDHLGMYVQQNRFDVFASLCVEHGEELILYDRSSGIINRYYANPDWRQLAPPQQAYPEPLPALLASMDEHRHASFLHASTLIRDMGMERRHQLADAIVRLLPQLEQVAMQHVAFINSSPMLVCLQRADHVDVTGVTMEKALTLATETGAAECRILLIYVAADGDFCGAWANSVLRTIKP